VLGGRLSEIRPRRRAFVVSTPVVFGMMRVFLGVDDAGAEHSDVFYSIEEACAWLNIPTPTRDGPDVAAG
jgi:hypothetical protein